MADFNEGPTLMLCTSVSICPTPGQMVRWYFPAVLRLRVVLWSALVKCEQKGRQEP